MACVTLFPLDIVTPNAAAHQRPEPSGTRRVLSGCASLPRLHHIPDDIRRPGGLAAHRDHDALQSSDALETLKPFESDVSRPAIAEHLRPLRTAEPPRAWQGMRAGDRQSHRPNHR